MELILDSRLPSCLSSSLRSGHLEKKNNLGNRYIEQRQNTKHNKEPPSSPQKKKVELQPPRSKAGLLSFSTVPPGSNCLFPSLLGLWPCCRKVMSAVILVLFSLARVSTLSVGEGILPPWLESTPAVKKPLAVVRPCSHIRSFGGHCCPGVSKPVPAVII